MNVPEVILEALKFYGDPQTWKPYKPEPNAFGLTTRAVRDKGQAARAALRALGLDVPEPGQGVSENSNR